MSHQDPYAVHDVIIVPACIMQRCGIIRIPRINSGSPFHQELCRVGIVVQTSCHQRCVSFVLFVVVVTIWISSSSEEVQDFTTVLTIAAGIVELMSKLVTIGEIMNDRIWITLMVILNNL